MAAAVSDRRPFVALEITGRCQLTCTHCYASSDPKGTHGTMTTAHWVRVLDQAAGFGAPLVQLIGGEPTLHPDLPELVQHALDRHLKVEVYSNLVSVPSALWSVLEQPGVRLATSYYAPTAAGHEAVTRRKHSHDRTLRNIKEARRRGVPIRVGVIQVQADQAVSGAVAEMRAIGVARIHVDQVREIGRGARGEKPGVEQLCGRCADGRLAVSPDGRVWPCVFARWLVIGDIKKESLAEVDQAAAKVRFELNQSFGRRRTRIYGSGSDGGCEPSPCTPIIDGK